MDGITRQSMIGHQDESTSWFYANVDPAEKKVTVDKMVRRMGIG